MQIVIDIPEDVYTRLFDNGIQDNEIATDDICEMARALRLGTPIPKGHGDLIDRKDLLQLESKWYHLRNGDVACPKIDIDNAQAIIEAEREDKG